ncbi:MAG: cyclic nucleotide-binding domain-containing protein [Elusimicrobia bacterium]|nr:cyclic nucleotide-binding domain-containing protein [Elusimicrobiota bacterium]
MTEKRTENLKEIQLFSKLSDSDLGDFLRTFKKISYKTGAVIFKEGSAGETFFIIASGAVVIEKKLDKEGKKFKQLALLKKGDFFGEMAVLEKQPRFAQARALQDIVLYELDRNKLFDFIKKSPEAGADMLIEIIRVILRRLQSTSNELLMLQGFVEVLAKNRNRVRSRES